MNRLRLIFLALALAGLDAVERTALARTIANDGHTGDPEIDAAKACALALRGLTLRQANRIVLCLHSRFIVEPQQEDQVLLARLAAQGIQPS